MENIFDVYKGLHRFNDALYKATRYLVAIAKSGPFEKDRMESCRSAICRVRSETNVYLTGVIQAIEQQNAPAQTHAEIRIGPHGPIEQNEATKAIHTLTDGPATA
jgi:hypothetical protein